MDDDIDPSSRIFRGLNDDQVRAVQAVRGPVCILAGAGSGKTTTITRRIANQVSSGVLEPNEILAVTFTEKAAREMGSRLSALGVSGVRARTFHAEALAQYRAFSADTSEIVPSKAQILAGIVRRLPMPHKFVSLRDVASEIEWAKNRGISAERYSGEVDGHRPPLPPDLMAGVYSTYERRKARAGLMDFEDLLARTGEMLSQDARALDAVRGRYHAFTVDEYQDVNMLQQSLLDVWLGDGQEVCVVGDDYQSIFGFTGATPRYLLHFPDRYPDAHVVTLTANYRSTPQVLELANRLVPRLGGVRKTLRAIREDGPEPVFREHSVGEQEDEWILERARALYEGGVDWEQIAVLYRINGRSEELEEALSAARIPYQVRDGAFLRRPAARAVLARLKRTGDGTDVASAVRCVVEAVGGAVTPVVDGDEDGSDEEATRQADLARLLKLAEEYPGQGGVRGFIADLGRRFAAEEDGRGIQLLTYHRAKGLEFEAVFLPRLEDREMPFALSKTEEEIAEERRLLYVGVTRAKRHLFLSWATRREGERRRMPKPSPFLDEVRPRREAVAASAAPAAAVDVVEAVARQAVRSSVSDEHVELFLALKDWRLQRARADSIPAYVVFHDSTLARLAEARPRSLEELSRVPGVGPAKLSRYADEVLALING